MGAKCPTPCDTADALLAENDRLRATVLALLALLDAAAQQIGAADAPGVPSPQTPHTSQERRHG